MVYVPNWLYNNMVQGNVVYILKSVQSYRLKF